MRPGEGERPGSIGVPRSRRGKCQRQIAHICCTESARSTLLVQPLGTVEHLGDHLRSSRVLRSLVCLCGLLRTGLPQAPQDRDRGPLRGWEKLLGMEAGLR